MKLDDKPRTVPVPAAVKRALAGNARAKAVFDELARSHKKEYVQWITGAKQEETRARRINQMIAMLLKKERVKL